MKRKTGTREWSGSSLNIQKGCSHGCKYCYAHAMAARFGRGDDWTKEEILDEAVNKGYGRRSVGKQPIMFPTTHDITPDNLAESLIVLFKLLKAGNDVLIVSKPHNFCAEVLTRSLLDFQRHVEFRFTIGSADDKALEFWEPNAPGFGERMYCLILASKKGYKTSISCEPMLDDKIEEVVDAVRPYASEVWLGKMNKIEQRLKQNGADEETLKKGRELAEMQSDENILKLYEKYKNDPIIKWKDSIKEVVGLP